MNSEDVVPPLAANMRAAFKKVRGAIGAADPVLTDLIVTRIVELAKDGVYDIEELSSRTLSSLKVGRVSKVHSIQFAAEWRLPILLQFQPRLRLRLPKFRLGSTLRENPTRFGHNALRSANFIAFLPSA